jgi:hypothetical protein
MRKTIKNYFNLILLILGIQFVFASPDWQDDPGAYEFTATIAGALVMNDGEQMGDEGDILAAFDEDGNVRGIGLMLFPPFGPYQGTPVFEVQLRSNDAGDILSFKYYDASTDAILDITETYTFIINDVIGDVIDLITLNIGSEDLSCPACEDVGLFGGAMACAAAIELCGTIAFGTEDGCSMPSDLWYMSGRRCMWCM